MFHECQFLLKEVLDYEKKIPGAEWLQSGIQTSMLLSEVKFSIHRYLKNKDCFKFCCVPATTPLYP
jgi:hypothetical protein